MKRSLALLVLFANAAVSASAQSTDHTVIISPVHLTNLSTRAMIGQYCSFAHRTPIIAPGLPEATFSLDFTPPILNSDAMRMAADALAAKDILVIPDGRIFVLVVPKSWEKTVQPLGAQIRSRPISPTNQMVKYGGIDLHDGTVSQVMNLYARLAKVTVEPGSPTNFAGVKIDFTTNQSITREEAMYALRTLLLWNNVKINFVAADLISAEPVAPK